jgi:NAD+ synthase (glutamine-hydrolysing)
LKILRLALAQINCTVGDLKGNADLIVRAIQKAKAAGADLVVLPELAIDGYPPEDLLLKPHFVEDNQEALEYVAGEVEDIMAVVGYTATAGGKSVANSAAILYNGRLVDVYHKIHLPNYGVFDEVRYFKPGETIPVYTLGQFKIGVLICQDIWQPLGPACKQACFGGAEVIAVLNASPYHRGKRKEREDILKARATEARSFIAYCNLVGGQDELVFDGEAMVVSPTGEVIARGRQFAEDLLVTDIDTRILEAERSPYSSWACKDRIIKNDSKDLKKVVVDTTERKGDMEAIRSIKQRPLPPDAEVYEALKLGVRDYVKKNGFEKVVLGLSGGIDSALTLAIAVDALGAENVTAVFMPSGFTQEQSCRDSEMIASNLNVKLRYISIEETFISYKQMMSTEFDGLPEDITEENIQARIRGNILMALANKFGWMVLATGNKSELAVGYSTLYGDMAGGFEVIKDIPKTLVYKLAEYRNTISKAIPKSIIDRAPTAELREGQKDSDSLPPYDVLDPIILAYVEEDKSPEEIIDSGFDRKVVLKVISMIDHNEYKRRQAPPGIKITPKAFGKDRRLPITNWYRK